MGKSSGARPRKAQRAEVAALREELGRCSYDQWQRAHGIFREICALCNHSGAKGGIGNPYPRCCTLCGKYGHSRKFCPLQKVLAERELDYEVQQMRAELAERRAAYEGEPDPVWIAKMQAADALYRAKCDAGLEGCERDGGPCTFLPGSPCAACKAWRAYAPSM